MVLKEQRDQLIQNRINDENAMILIKAQKREIYKMKENNFLKWEG